MGAKITNVTQALTYIVEQLAETADYGGKELPGDGIIAYKVSTELSRLLESSGHRAWTPVAKDKVQDFLL